MADAASIVPRSEPQVLLRVKVDGADERVALGDRLVGFTFEDSDNKTDKASTRLDNWDLFFFDSPLIVKGALLEVSWSYRDRMSPVRELVVRTVEGFTTLQVEAHARSVLMNRLAMCRVFDNVTRADVARRIAEENGFSGAFAEIEDTEEIFECINQAGETDARLHHPPRAPRGVSLLGGPDRLSLAQPPLRAAAGTRLPLVHRPEPGRHPVGRPRQRGPRQARALARARP